jgi:muramoyltetrapeptide carboxypeptidase
MMNEPLYPPRLKKGDTIGIFAPAGRLDDSQRFIDGVKILREMGFEVKFPTNLWPGREYLADTDENRASEINLLLRDPGINGLIALRGGYGCMRMIDKIDLSLVRSNPKLIVGFSDITILQNYLYAKTGLVSLHGPVVASLGNADRASLERLYLCLTGEWLQTIQDREIEVLRKGAKATAPLIGGNLASLVALLGTCYDFSWDNKIIFLEDINEPAYRVDRMLTQLKLAGKFDNIAGLILGKFTFTENSGKNNTIRYRETIWTRALELCDRQSIPVWANFPSGHCSHNFTLIFGAAVEMSQDKPLLSFFPGGHRGGI